MHCSPSLHVVSHDLGEYHSPKHTLYEVFDVIRVCQFWLSQSQLTYFPAFYVLCTVWQPLLPRGAAGQRLPNERETFQLGKWPFCRLTEQPTVIG